MTGLYRCMCVYTAIQIQIYIYIYIYICAYEPILILVRDILLMLTNKREFNSSALTFSAYPGKEMITGQGLNQKRSYLSLYF